MAEKEMWFIVWEETASLNLARASWYYVSWYDPSGYIAWLKVMWSFIKGQH